MENTYDVMKSALRLARAIRRSAPKHDHVFPPAVERTLITLSENDGLSSGELCETLGVRPSSLSELIDKMEKFGLAERSIDEQDKRIVRIELTEQGSEIAGKIAEKFNTRRSEIEACFEDGEAEQFCMLADKLSTHLQGGEDDLPPCRGRGPRGFGPGCKGPEGFGPGFGGPEMNGPGFGPGCKDPEGFGPGFGGPEMNSPGFGPGCKGPEGLGPQFGPGCKDPESFSPQFGPRFGGPGHGPGMHHCHRFGGHGMHKRFGCKGPSVQGQFRHSGPWDGHKPEFRHPGPWDGHKPEFRHPGPWDCHKPEVRHPGPWDCHRSEFRSC